MNTRKLRKVLLTLCSALLLVSLSVGVTVAYLTSQDSVVNTFTVGNVKIDLDEAAVNPDGTYVSDENERREANIYKFYPNRTYHKDPTVTVLAGSDDAYVRVLVTVNKLAELDKIFADHKYDLSTIVLGASSDWTIVAATPDDAAQTRTYELRYNTKVSAPDNDLSLPAIFQQIKVPSDITKEELATLGNTAAEGAEDNALKITVVAQAIQADGFADADAAWDVWADRADDNI